MNAIKHLLPHNPASAFKLLPFILCERQRRSLASLIANVWARQDINTAWNTISRSTLNAADKQVMYNELWS